MTIRVNVVGGTLMIAIAVVVATAGCAAQDTTYDPKGRCLHFQLDVSAQVHHAVAGEPSSWDLIFTDTSPVPCVFGGVPAVHFWAKTSTPPSPAGSVQGAVSQEIAVPLGAGEKAYANITLDSSATTACKPVRVRSISVVAPHVAGGGWIINAPAKFMGCRGTQVVAQVGQVTAHRTK